MERLLLPLKQNFTTLGNFLNYMRVCVQAAIISRMASLNTAEGKAWEKAHNKLIELRQETLPASTNLEEQVTLQAGTISTLEAQLSEISTQVAREQVVSTSKSGPKFQQGKNLKS
eukprot:3628839-Rhodomonas_salina.1